MGSKLLSVVERCPLYGGAMFHTVFVDEIFVCCLKVSVV